MKKRIMEESSVKKAWEQEVQWFDCIMIGTRYKVVRVFENENTPSITIKNNLTIEEAKDHCKDPETSSSTCKLWHNRNRTKRLGRWFDCMDINLGWKERRRAIRIKNQLDYLTIERDTEQ